MTRSKFIDIMPDHSTDVILMTLINNELHTMVTTRTSDKSDPYPNALGLAGVYLNVKIDETYESAAIRALREKAHLTKIPYLEQLQSFGDRTRDKRHWTGTLVFIGYVSEEEVELTSDDVRWLPVSDIDTIDNWAFDHKEIIKYAIKKVQEQAQYSTQVIKMLGNKFTQPQLQELYEIVLEEKLDKSSFRKQVRESGLLFELEGEKLKPAKGAPAQCYRVNEDFQGFFFPRSIAKKQKTK
jgi:8-oxo-dGTP diphosphatase